MNIDRKGRLMKSTSDASVGKGQGQKKKKKEINPILIQSRPRICCFVTTVRGFHYGVKCCPSALHLPPHRHPAIGFNITTLSVNGHLDNITK